MTRDELKEQREHDKRIGYQKSCRKLIAYQIDEWKETNGHKHNYHLDHVIPFSLIVDTWRTMLQIWLKQDKLPVSISSFSNIGKMFMKYHAEVAVYQYIPAKENLEKAAGQTRSKGYGLNENTLLLYESNLKKMFIKLFGQFAVIPERTIKDCNKGKALQNYSKDDCN
jgi:hypothetical protein